MKLTHKTALEKSIKLFKWLAKHPDAEKSDYFLKYIKPPYPQNYCYLCALYFNNDNCEGCIRWYLRESKRHESEECADPLSPYYKLRRPLYMFPKNREKYALQVVKLLEENLHNSPD